VWLWTKPAGNVHLPATPLFLRVGMLSWIQEFFSIGNQWQAPSGSSMQRINTCNKNPQKYHQAPTNVSPEMFLDSCMVFPLAFPS